MGMTTIQTGQMWRRDVLRPSHVALLVLALPLLAILAFVLFQPIQVLPRISLAPGFSFVDQNGQRLTSEDLRGSLVLYNFTYTGCGEGCPQTGPAMRSAQELLARLDTDGIPVQLVTVSFDPDRDSPEQLRAFATSLEADTANWHFVTGDAPQLKNVIGRGFGAYYERKEDSHFVFDPTFVLVDGWGVIRAKYRMAQPAFDMIERDIGLIVQEVRNSKGVNKIAYEAAHLFLCYPN